MINDNLRFTSAPPNKNDRSELGSYDDRDDHVFVNVCCDHVFFYGGWGGGGGSSSELMLHHCCIFEHLFLYTIRC